MSCKLEISSLETSFLKGLAPAVFFSDLPTDKRQSKIFFFDSRIRECGMDSKKTGYDPSFRRLNWRAFSRMSNHIEHKKV